MTNTDVHSSYSLERRERLQEEEDNDESEEEVNEKVASS
jgi:hypothetical protein